MIHCTFCQGLGCHICDPYRQPPFPHSRPDWHLDELVKKMTTPESRLAKAKREQEELRRKVQAKRRDIAEAAEAEKVEKENEELRKELEELEARASREA